MTRRIGLHNRYAMSGTDIAYATTSLEGSNPARRSTYLRSYAFARRQTPTRTIRTCPVLMCCMVVQIQCIVVSAYAHLTSGPVLMLDIVLSAYACHANRPVLTKCTVLAWYRRLCCYVLPLCNAMFGADMDYAAVFLRFHSAMSVVLLCFCVFARRCPVLIQAMLLPDGRSTSRLPRTFSCMFLACAAVCAVSITAITYATYQTMRCAILTWAMLLPDLCIVTTIIAEEASNIAILVRSQTLVPRP
eukprot:1401937-Rhodomonas_salina.2